MDREARRPGCRSRAVGRRGRRRGAGTGHLRGRRREGHAEDRQGDRGAARALQGRDRRVDRTARHHLHHHPRLGRLRGQGRAVPGRCRQARLRLRAQRPQRCSGQLPLRRLMWPRVRDQRLLVASLGGLVALAWVSLWIWRSSPYGRFLSHGENGGIHTLGNDYLALMLVFVAGWTLMTVAMMLPTSLPLVALFNSVVRVRPHRLQLVTLLIVGYLAVWTAFAVVVHAADLGLHRTVDSVGWLDSHAWIISAATILFV